MVDTTKVVSPIAGYIIKDGKVVLLLLKLVVEKLEVLPKMTIYNYQNLGKFEEQNLDVLPIPW